MEITDYKIFVKTHGKVLFEGKEFALNLGDALIALQLLKELNIAVLGGDVYFRNRDSIEPGYANWHTDRIHGESDFDYCQRTWAETEQYLTKFPKYSNLAPLFVFVT